MSSTPVRQNISGVGNVKSQDLRHLEKGGSFNRSCNGHLSCQRMNMSCGTENRKNAVSFYVLNCYRLWPERRNPRHLGFSSPHDLVNSKADPLTLRSTRSLESTYVPHTTFDRSNISGGIWVLTSWSTFLALSTS